MKIIPRSLIIRGMTFESEYLAEFALIFQTNLGYESGDQEVDFDERR
jgi:hypothetical protein